MPFALGPLARESGYRLIAYDTIHSTNAEAIRLALEGDRGRLWVVAGEQTDGRGRRGRVWHAPNGNLAASLFYMPRFDRAASVATLGFVAGLAVHDAVGSVAPEIAGRLRLKWPNDVLIGNAKMAGILLEAVSTPAAPNGVVVGIGINVRHAPAEVPFPATSLAHCGVEMESETLFPALSDAWVVHEALWARGGFDAVREHWLNVAAGVGSSVTVRLASDTVRGTFETVDREGHLMLRTDDGSLRTVSAGDVHFGPAATEFEGTAP